MEIFMKGEDAPLTNSGDLDFSDVFGGPPRRWMRGCGGYGETVAAAEEDMRPELREKPVFGGRRAVRRRDHHDDHFFDDIFRGDESYSSPWKIDRHREPFCSFPARSSVPAKLSKVVEFPTFASRAHEYKMDGLSSPYSSSASFSRSSNETVRGQDEMIRNETHQSPFSGNATLSCEDSPYTTTSHQKNNVEKMEKDGKNIDKNSNRYHFFANVKGDFAKIFNEEADSRPKTDVKKQSQSCRWMAAGIEQKENDQVEPQQWPQTKTADYKSNDVYTSKKTASSSESLSWDSKILGEDSDDTFEHYFVLQELSDDLEQSTPRSEASEETKALDTKIGQWSAGKKGNIRSLLSTLQYILWAGSEWKPIALVDLVEANPVKRAYQKALLHLHPDKLQQKGAASNHKYIAEKVFDILQEAWDHFNNVAPV